MRCQLNMNYRPILFCCKGFFCLALILLPVASIAAEIVFVPAIGLVTEYDDNIDFTRNSDLAKDDFAGSVIPQARLEYSTQRLNLNATGQLDFKKYLNETDFDRTNHLYLLTRPGACCAN